ncbi:leucine-rich repeat-containing protein 71 isoform X2 [Silurus asotus]|uniref:Leucine-rich repeat-containing protein 71 isoform X2 n=1 Tax=Silurus asotus TaxID=30991 RepID=A0AAD5ARI3_SILAS|nr:leucine-rich repeat-containing protein 71 isoform X2 [Silurus asotus]
MKKRMEKVNKEKGTSGLDEETSQTAGLNKQNTSRVQNIDDYQCTGDLRVDIPELCASVGLEEIPDVKLITTESPSTERAPDGSHEQVFSESCMVTWSPKPCLQIEMENEEPRSVKRVRISGWKVDEKMAQILSKALPSLSNLQSLETVFLEGTPIPENSYHILMAEDSLITHLSLRNNHIGEDGARLISLALCKSLLSLNLAFNAVGNVGATYLAQGLRLNRTLLYLSLANNHIGDAGAAQLAQVFGPFALTHEEIVERRRELKKKEQLDDTKKDEKPLTNQTMTMTGKKEDTKGEKKKSEDL